MSITDSAVPTDGLPPFPPVRPTSCPFDPPAEYAEWRGQPGLQRVSWNGIALWSVNRYSEIKQVLADPRTSANTMGRLQPDFPTEASTFPFPRTDAPEHNRIRRMLTKDFTVKRVDTLRPQIQALTDRALDQMIAGGAPADLVREFALPVPSLAISLILGVPYRDHELFERESKRMVDFKLTQEENLAAVAALFDYLQKLIAEKEQNPGDDLLSRVLVDHVANGELDHDQLATNSVILLAAGHETTANMIALSTLCLLQHPDQLARVRDSDDPAFIANAVNELLRFLTVANTNTERIALEDMEVGGQVVHAGEGLVMNLHAGNTDPAFIDNPDRLDVGRELQGHITFGFGPHQCMGQLLARAELEIALPTLLRRLPKLRLAVPLEDIEFRANMGVYGVHELPVAW
jgi:cytochrome P450